MRELPWRDSHRTSFLEGCLFESSFLRTSRDYGLAVRTSIGAQLRFPTRRSRKGAWFSDLMPLLRRALDRLRLLMSLTYADLVLAQKLASGVCSCRVDARLFEMRLLCSPE